MDIIKTSIFDLYKVGLGSSSSHVTGPMRAGLKFRKHMKDLSSNELKSAAKLNVTLYGSLSSTGKGHGTDRAVTAGLLGMKPETCEPEYLANLLEDKKHTYTIDINNISIPFSEKNIKFGKIRHSFPFNNTMIIKLLDANEQTILEKEYYSIGGGFVKCKGETEPVPPPPPYQYSNMNELKECLKTSKLSLSQLVLENEKVISGTNSKEIYQKIDEVIKVMEDSVTRGIKTKGLLPGPIGLYRKASTLYKHARSLKYIEDLFLILLNAYALAAAEENAAGHRVVTAPTNGSAGVIPGILYALKYHKHLPKKLLREGFLASAAIGFIIKNNASISGAEVGCQGEIGAAAAMAAALIAYVHGHPIIAVENAAEIALEHHLGMTCDPVMGYVQIPCIERNAVAAVTAYNAYLLALTGDPNKQKVTFDEVVEAMLRTGRDMSTKYKETGKGGLAICT